MFQINKVRIIIETEKDSFGYETNFEKGLNFLSSAGNTYGKSSILAAVYYCLGLEEIIGGKNDKVLTSVYKSEIKKDDEVIPVLESGAYLEITNGQSIVTLYRSAKMTNRDSRMITVYYSDMDHVMNESIEHTDTFVHMPNSATNEKGFHHFLEQYLYLELPEVQATDEKARKLYLQLVFSAMFIEQKHGWADLFSGMPILGIKESKKRVIEYILGLDTFKNEKRKQELNIEKSEIEREWHELYDELVLRANRNSCTVINYPIKPRILTEDQIDGISIIRGKDSVTMIIEELKKELDNYKRITPRVKENYDDLEIELRETESSVKELEEHLQSCREQYYALGHNIKKYGDDLEIIKTDLTNNKDAARLQKLGSDFGLSTAKSICPFCGQSIKDSLLPGINNVEVMSIDENIKHLEAQKQMIDFAINGYQQQREELNKEMASCQSRIAALLRLAKSIRSDLYSVNEDFSEAIVYKRISNEQKIESLEELQRALEDKKSFLIELSDRWKNNLAGYERIPEKKLSENDTKKLELLREKFIDNLQKYGYKSIHNLSLITISDESHLPLYEGFDMKFDSSASDNIRVIWAFTMALLQVSIEMGGNHPSVLIFDEPDQQSTMIEDMKAFLQSIIDIKDKCQVIIAITLKDQDTKKAISDFDKNTYNMITVPDKAIRKMN